jgi:hypothetical protein
MNLTHLKLAPHETRANTVRIIGEAVVPADVCARIERERDTLKVVLRELLAIMPRATCENLPHDSLDVHPRSTCCWALQHFEDTVSVAKGLVYVKTKEDAE